MVSTLMEHIQKDMEDFNDIDSVYCYLKDEGDTYSYKKILGLIIDKRFKDLTCKEKCIKIKNIHDEFPLGFDPDPIRRACSLECTSKDKFLKEDPIDWGIFNEHNAVLIFDSEKLIGCHLWTYSISSYDHKAYNQKEICVPAMYMNLNGLAFDLLSRRTVKIIQKMKEEELKMKLLKNSYYVYKELDGLI